MGGKTPKPKRYSWLLIPIVTIIVSVLIFIEDGPVWNPAGIIPALNVLVIAPTSIIISLLAARSYLKDRSMALLLLGCGTLALGVGSAFTALPPIAEVGNSIITMYMASVTLASLCHLLSAMNIAYIDRPKIAPGWSLLIISYLIILLLLIIFLIMVVSHIFPPFFIPGSGQTNISLFLLFASISGFVLSSILLWMKKDVDKTGFFYYYSVGLAMISIGLFGVSQQTYLGDYLNWVGRTSQYIGTVFMLVAALTSVRGGGTWLLPVERALQESERRYQSLVTLSPDAILVQVDDKLIFANPSAARLLGASSPEELIGIRTMDLIHRDHRDRFGEHLVEMRNGLTIVPWTSKFVRLDGNEVDVEISGSKVEFGTKPGIQAIVRDISGRKMIEDSLRESEAKYRGLFNNIQESVVLRRIVLDEDGKIVDLELMDANPSHIKTLGIRSIQEIKGSKYSDLHSPEMVSWTMDHVRKVLATGGPITEESPYDVNDRTYHTTSVLLSTNLILSSSFDITERKLAEEALRESNEYLEMLIGKANAPIIVWDPELVITRFNHAFELLTGISAREAIGSDLSMLFPEASRDSSMELIRQAMKGKHMDVAEIPIQHRSGQIRTVLWNSANITGNDSQLRATIAQGQDITDRKKAEDEVKRSNAELQQFAYVASHDLQEPLRMVVSYLALIERKYQDQLDDKGKEYIRFAVDGGKRMRELIDDLLEYSRVNTKGKEFAMVNMNTVVEDTLKFLKEPIEKNHVDIVIQPLPTIMADRSQIQQVVQNLITNAIKFRKGENPKIEISYGQNGFEHIFSVRDNGIGIDPKYKDKLFHMFQRLHTRDEYEGTGIGLAISKKIVERHGGRIWFESDGNNGSIFFFSILKFR